MTGQPPARRADTAGSPTTWDIWTRRLGAFAVASVAAYASYQHQLDFALAGGSDLTTARLWPLSVDGLLVLSTAGLLRDTRRANRRSRWTLRAAFAVGIMVSLAANIATAASMTWAPVLVAGWPPVALLLAVELLGLRQLRYEDHPAGEHERDTVSPAESAVKTESENVSRPENEEVVGRVVTLGAPQQSRRTAEQVMWDHYQHTVAAGLPAPTGAELDHIAETNNYGRAVLRKWCRQGRTGPPSIPVVR